MSRTLENLSRSLANYGQQAGRITRSGVQAAALRESSRYHQMAADTRARAQEQRGQRYGGLVSNLGGMVRDEILQGPIREREIESHDLGIKTGEQNLELGGQQLQMGEEQIAAVVKAREDEEQYLQILVDNRRDPSAIIEALHDVGMADRANAYYQDLMDSRAAAANAGKAETEEVAAKFRNLAELFLGFQESTPREDWDASYPVIKRQAEEYLAGTAPDLMQQLPDKPDDATYLFMRNIAIRARDLADRLKAEEKRVDIATKKQDLRQDKVQDEDKGFVKGLHSMSKSQTPGGWDAQREFLKKNRLGEDQAPYFDSMVPMEYSEEAKEQLKAFLKDKENFPEKYQAALDTGFEGSFLDWLKELAKLKRSERWPPAGRPKFPADYQAARDTGFKGTFLDWLEEMEKLKARKGGGMIHPQALANIRQLAEAVKERQYEDEFEGMNQEQITRAIASEWHWDLKKLRDISGGNPKVGRFPMKPAPTHGPAPAAGAETRELNDGSVWEKTESGWKRIK